MPVPLTAEAPRALLDSLLLGAPVGLAFVDREFRYRWVNHELAAIDGSTAEELLGRTVAERVPSLWPMLEPMYRRALSGEPVVHQEVEGVHSDALPGVRQWDVSFFPVRDGDAITGVGLMVYDITERKTTQAALAIRNDLYAMLSRTSQSVCQCHSADALFRDLCTIAVDSGRFTFAWVGVPDSGVLRVVARAGEDSGYMDGLVIPLDEHDPRSQGPTGRAARTGEAVVVNDFHASAITRHWHERARRVGFASSAAFPIMERGKVAAVLTLYAPAAGFFTDDLRATLDEITPTASFALDALALEAERRQDELERRRRESQASQTQKMEALGRLAGGIAHDFNNLLAAINGFSELALEEVAGDSSIAESLIEIRKAGEQGAMLTRQLLAFSRKQEMVAREVSVNDVVRDTANLLGRLLGRQVQLDTRLQSSAGTVLLDPGQLTQVLVNLAVNARDAMPNGGTLCIETSARRVERGSDAARDGLSPGDYVRLSVSDTGTGMDETTRSRLFEPFFTTKADGQGTGLGLATVHGIVEQMRGAITVRSVVGEGTTFIVMLPRMPD